MGEGHLRLPNFNRESKRHTCSMVRMEWVLTRTVCRSVSFQDPGSHARRLSGQHTKSYLERGVHALRRPGKRAQPCGRRRQSVPQVVPGGTYEEAEPEKGWAQPTLWRRQPPLPGKHCQRWHAVSPVQGANSAIRHLP